MINNEELDDLVREVLQENPPEEQGIRPEWQNHVGWHRREDIFRLRGRQEKTEHLIDQTKSFYRNENETNRDLPREENESFKVSSVPLIFSVPVTIALTIVCVRKYYCKSNLPCGIKLKKIEAEMV